MTRDYRKIMLLKLRMLFLCILMLLANTPETKKGFGQSKERPVGTPFILPAGVTIQGKIKGYSVFETEYCDDKTEDDAQGIGSMVRIYLPFYNDNHGAVSITCPQGLVFIARQVPGEREKIAGV